MITTDPWYKTLEDPERVFAVMRAIDAESTALYERAKAYAPQWNEVQTGAPRLSMEAETLRCFLSFLRRGESPETACFNAKTRMRQLLYEWNAKCVDAHDHIWVGAFDQQLETLRDSILAAAGSEPVRAEEGP